MSSLRCAVIGGGYLGRFHAQKYNMLSNANLVAICDINRQACEVLSQELNVPAYMDYRELFGQVDAVSIAATTNKHYEIAKDCLAQGIHVLIEKPITETVAQANELIELANKNQVKLQVGHLERFNAARLALDSYLERPLFIESNRLAPFNPRGTDVNVILDLMIHDIDLIQAMVKSPIVSIDAQGAPVLSKSIDIANARLTFENHCVANVTASRVSFKSERKTRIFQSNSYISIDYQNKQFAVFERGPGEMFPGIPEIIRHESVFEKGDALLEEIKAFLNCIENNSTPLVTGEDGRDALEVAAKITSLIHNNLEQRNAF
ncbi:Gfo/Idh/MocA family protein [Legionella jordanis]|uniref:Oxidoreductase n=1 Tax=Legionella jordanis TaxID=456 RepID=A0A0W0V7I2_9GAMM|nr:Gfo/Idh/MocA family oxidoreductase [Legionella jordanis]KTD16097.1 oxidoreductase [Legionella jordanis]RMX04735.1 gfo/Idh/MocA family oxidoreductase [Legionella jordanis]RMX18432.1 gfo/Idh/MocA family oxidoreductase [Legionella jordanis]VEH12443.1 oxidoreductase [Legionella jordanis]HAT8713954.1 gfo/Idh/MocA family oxidoreductase [Legionella jordanis]